VSEPRASVLGSLKLVAWAMLGIRSNKGYREDLAKVNPLHVVVVGLVSVLGLVIGLVALVNWVVAK
jgi:polyferredoxin